MDERTENQMEGWESKPLTGGFAELRELADGGFSGAARAGTTTLFMLNGRVVGVFGGSIEDFDGAEATVFKAPHPSLPLLFAMEEHGGETQAKNYTEDTPISAARNQLKDAGFTGYIELSENVLSGDYYVVFYGGRAMSCAFVGNSSRLETGDDAFHLADDEVGIYEVVAVDVEVTDIPDGAGDTTQQTAEPDAATSTPDGPGQGGDVASPAGGEQPTTGGQQSAGGAGRQESAETQSGRPTGDGTPSEPEVDPGGRAGRVADEPREESTSRTRTPAESAASEDPPTDAGRGDAGSQPDESGPAADEAERSSPEELARSPADTGAAPEEAAASEATETDRSAGEPSPEPDDAPSRRGGPDEPDAGAPADAAEASSSGTDDGGRPGATASGSPAPREEAAADRAVEAASGPGGSAATGTVTAGDGVPKSQTSLGDLRPVPSLSPDKTHVADPGDEAVTRADDTPAAGSSGASDPDSASGTAAAGGTGRDESTGGSRTDGRRGTDQSVGSTRPRSGSGTDVTERASQAVDVDVDAGGEAGQVPDDAGATELRRELAAREERIEELETAITDLRVQRDGLTDERNRLESEVERLESEVERLETEVDDLRSQLSDGTEGKQRLSREDALEGTNLFIRYASKSGGTLEKAQVGEVDREEVNENLRLEHHTQFEADDVVVEDKPFDEFLRGTIYRGFVEWVVRDLLYEIQDTGHVKQLRELHDAIPKVDRAELLGDVSVQYTEDGEQYREQRSFDVVLRDRMGNPLVVGNLNDSRNPADREMMETVIQNGIDVKESNESLASAMMVTASFFKPGALEAADEAHGGSLLGRDSKDSYVKLNRKSGYHLILVESRGGDFHVNVPEL